MRLKHFSLLVFFLLASGSVGTCFGQNQNSIWCFGDSSGIDFSSGSAQNFVTSLDSRGTCASIADDQGQILFYAGTRALPNIGVRTGIVYNRLNQKTPNGDTLMGSGWYNEMMILPFPSDPYLYYLITAHGTPASYKGIYYSVIDVRVDGGMGDIVQKNVMISSIKPWDALAAVRHANGRDWWVVAREFVDTIASGGNRFHVFLVDPNGITASSQAIGLSRYGDLGNLTFSPQGDRLLFTSYNGIIALFDFDRCTGTLSNQVIIDQQNTDVGYVGACFSPNGQRIYVSANNEESVLYQYDLTAPVIRYTQLPLDTNRECLYSGGQLRLAPDGKVYWSSGWYNGHQFPYPYQDTMYHPVNTHLSVINDPDALGAACNYVRFGHYLGGKRTYWGLPNNPDYSLGPVAGSICDSLTTNVTAPPLQQAALHLFYHPDWKQLFVNASGIKGTRGQLQLYNTTGALLHTEPASIQPPYYTRQLDLSNLAQGVYILVLQTNTERLSGRFVKP